MNQLCKVCGEPAAGFHFGAFTCEGCKSFFGRTYNNLGSVNECKNNGGCTINKKNRTSCKACRLRKCLKVGMSKSGSRYGRRSNWFKIHCLLQEQTSLDSTIQDLQLNGSLGDSLDIGLHPLKQSKRSDLEIPDNPAAKDENCSPVLSSPGSQISETSLEIHEKFHPSQAFVNYRSIKEGAAFQDQKLCPYISPPIQSLPFNKRISYITGVDEMAINLSPYLVKSREMCLPLNEEQDDPIDLSIKRCCFTLSPPKSNGSTVVPFEDKSSVPLDLRKKTDMCVPASAS